MTLTMLVEYLVSIYC